MCARHIYGNLRRVYPGKDLPKKLFCAVAALTIMSIIEPLTN